MTTKEIKDIEAYFRSFLENGKEDQAVAIFNRRLTGFLEIARRPVNVRPLDPDFQAMAAMAVRLFGNEDGPQIVENCCVQFTRSNPDILIRLAVIERQLLEGEADGDAE